MRAFGNVSAQFTHYTVFIENMRLSHGIIDEILCGEFLAIIAVIITICILAGLVYDGMSLCILGDNLHNVIGCDPFRGYTDMHILIHIAAQLAVAVFILMRERSRNIRFSLYYICLTTVRTVEGGYPCTIHLVIFGMILIIVRNIVSIFIDISPFDHFVDTIFVLARLTAISADTVVVTMRTDIFTFTAGVIKPEMSFRNSFRNNDGFLGIDDYAAVETLLLALIVR